MTQLHYRNPAKAYLQRYRAARTRQQSLLRAVADLRESLTGTTQALKSDVVTGSGPTDRMAAVVAEIADMEAAMADALAEVNQALRDTLAAIDAVPDETQRAVLTMRYVEGLGWTDIQERMNYERTQAFVIHGRALVAVNEWLSSNDSIAKGETN